jgi:acetyl esterase/lipase
VTFIELFSADVRIHRDIPYGSVGDPRQLLDLYAPPDAQGLPVVVFFYGGGWRSGDKRLFEHLGRAFAVRGIVAVTVNYRLTPAVRSPVHAEDCAEAVAWVHREIAAYGGDPGRIVLMGHSAGAHLAALLTLDQHYLSAHTVPPESIRGLVFVSGVVDLNEHVGSTMFTSREFIEEAFGSTPEELAAASPISYIRAGLPPVLVVIAEKDPPGLREQGKRFADVLREYDNDPFIISVRGRDHFSIVRRFGPDDDTTAMAIVEFVKKIAK